METPTQKFKFLYCNCVNELCTSFKQLSEIISTRTHRVEDANCTEIVVLAVAFLPTLCLDSYGCGLWLRIAVA